MISRNIVLNQSYDIGEIFKLVDSAVSNVNRISGLAFAYTELNEDECVTYFFWPEFLRNKGWICLVDDESIPAKYIDVTLPSEDLVKELVGILSETLPTVATGALKEIARNQETRDAGSIARLGLLSPCPFDREIEDLLKMALDAEDVDIRRAATLAAFLLKWKELVPTLESTLSTESDANLRKQLQLALEACKSGQITLS